MEIKKVAMIGAGQMGNQIAMQAAISGYDVVCYSRRQETVDHAVDFAKKWFDKTVSKGKMEADKAEEIQKRLKFTTSLQEAAADREDLKRRVLKQVDSYAPEHAIYASNSSYIVSSRFCDAVRHPENMLNLHFFNPALVMKVVEVVRGPHTSQETVDAVYGFAD